MTGALLNSAAKVVGSRLNALAQRPFIWKDGQAYVLAHDSSGNVGRIRTNATALLQYDEWKDIDRTVIEAAVQRMTGIADLRERGLEHNLGSIGATVSLWDRMSDMTAADLSMDARKRGSKDTPAFATQMVPVPIVHKDFDVELRRLEASRRFGESIDVSAAGISGRLVGERSESLLFSGSTEISSDGNPIYGYTTHPDRNKVNLGTHWDALDGSAGENVQILEDVMAMMAASRAARHYGPWVLYIPAGYEAKMDEDYRGSSSSDPRTVRERILALKGIEDVKVADFLADHNVVLVSLVKDVVDLAVAQDITTVQWTTTGGMVEEFRVMAVWVPRIKSDFAGHSGVTHLYDIS